MAKWLVPHLRCLTLPVAVNRKRFLVDLCVFCLVMAKQTLLLVALVVLNPLAIRINGDKSVAGIGPVSKGKNGDS
jgi:hypothetical protein